MMERTLAIIKPDAMAAGHADAIVAMIKDHGFSIIKSMRTKLTLNEAQGFYLEHRARPFYNEMTNDMTSGEVIVMVLERDNAVKGWRDLMGATNPAEAAEGTVRKLYGSSVGKNATHGSDLPVSAACEIIYFFPHL